jgi:Flp pilus assembly protein TadD
MRSSKRLNWAVLLLLSAGCSLQPFNKTPPPTAPTTPPTGQGPSVPVPETVPPPGQTEPVIEAPLPPPVPKERPKVAPAKLSPASQALVTQAQSQRKRGDLPGATVSLERALRIEPSNPLLWIEMGRLRMDQRNYAQAEAMGRKALSVAVGDNRAQSAAWLLIADSFKARGRDPEAEEAVQKSKELTHS